MVIELIEGSAIWAEIICVISKSNEFDLKSQVWFQTKITRHEVQLLLYHIYFEITQIQDLVISNILLMQSWAGLKLNSSIFFLGGGGSKSLETEFATWYSVCHFSAIWSVTLNKPWNLIGCFIFSVASSLPGKKMRFKAKNWCDSWINHTN